MAEETLDQLITSTRKNLDYDVKDDELIIAINDAIAESKILKTRIDQIGKINKLFWQRGTDKDLNRLHPKKSKLVDNRIFTDVETAIPILTSEVPDPNAVNSPDNDSQDKIQKALKIAYEVKYKMQQKLQCLIRHWFLFRLGVIKYRWDEKKGFVTENVVPRKIGFDKRATCKENCEFIWEELEEKVEDLVAKFPEKAREIKDITGATDKMKSKVRYIEFWGGNGEWVCWKIQNTILDKKKNPNFNYEDEQPVLSEETMGSMIPLQRVGNIFDNPEFPYIFLNVFNFGDETSLYDETSLIEQAAPLQEGVNMIERQILELNEGQKRVWVGTGEAMSVDIFQELIDKTGDLGVFLDRKAPAAGLQQVQSGKPDASLFDNLSHLLSEIDNIIGMHSTTRGERAQQETYGGRKLLKEADYGRLDLIVRNVEQVMEEWYNAYLQMLKVYSVEPEVLNDGKTTITLTREEIPNDILIMVKKGSTLPSDDIMRYQNAIQLAQMGMIDPVTLFEEMKYTKIDQRVQSLYQWLTLTGKIQPQVPEMGQGPATGQPGASGADLNATKSQQLQRIQNIFQSPEFQQMSPEQQQKMIGQAREAINQIKQ